MEVYKLIPQYDARKDFYGKAIVSIDIDGTKRLTSYSTEVAKIEPGKPPVVNGWYSATTARHINEFLQQNGYSKMTKREMEA